MPRRPKSVLRWSRCYSLGNDSKPLGRSVQQAGDGGYIIAGYTVSFNAGMTDAFAIKTDATGREQWSATLGESGNNIGNAVREATDGGYVIVGSAGTLVSAPFASTLSRRTRPDASSGVGPLIVKARQTVSMSSCRKVPDILPVGARFAQCLALLSAG